MTENSPGVACDCSAERYAMEGFTCYGCKHARRNHCARGRREFPLYEKPCGWWREVPPMTDTVRRVVVVTMPRRLVEQAEEHGWPPGHYLRHFSEARDSAWLASDQSEAKKDPYEEAETDD